MDQLRRSDFHIGIICALSIEMTAMIAALDHDYGIWTDVAPEDHNVYHSGCIFRHNIIIACLPAGVDGTTAAAVVATDLQRSFPQIHVGLLVGIGGGIPDLDHGVDIRLGDVVVSQPKGMHGGVVQHDKGKHHPGGQRESKGFLNAPPQVLLTALQVLQVGHEFGNIRFTQYLDEILERLSQQHAPEYLFPGQNKDVLYSASSDDNFPHSELEFVVERPRRVSSRSSVHYGIIASGNGVIKDAATRDLLRDRYGALCVEMEAAGIMNRIPCLVIRGICDYADRHKNDDWRRYAAATASALAKEVLMYVRVTRLRPAMTLAHHECHQVFKTSNYESQKDSHCKATEGTCQWVLDHDKFREWSNSIENSLFWVSADPGCGKSVLSKSMIDSHLEHVHFDIQESRFRPLQPIVCYFFFRDSDPHNRLSTALCAILHQLFSQQPDLIEHALPIYNRNGEKLQEEIGELWRILQNALYDTRATLTVCVIDALDECCEADRRKFIDLLCGTRDEGSMVTPWKSKLKWLVASRAYAEIEKQFNQIRHPRPVIRLRGEEEKANIQAAINMVIYERVDRLRCTLDLSTQKTAQIRQELQRHENHTYLWVILALDQFEKEYSQSLEPDKEIPKSLPSSLEDAYERILNRITQGKEEKLAKTILTIIIGAKRALSVLEMALALETATMANPPSSLGDLKLEASHLERNMRRWCGLFVVIHKSHIYLLHQTAKDFLLSQSKNLIANQTAWKHCLEPTEVNACMTRICILYLCLQDFKKPCKSVNILNVGWYKRSPDAIMSFFAFVAEHWAMYYRSIDGKTCSIIGEHLQAELQELYDPSGDLYPRWTRFMWEAGQYGHEEFKMQPLHLAVFVGHEQILRRLLTPVNAHLDSLDGSP